MKKTISISFAVIALLCMLTLPLFHIAFAKPSAAPRPYSHPEYQEAVEALRNARKSLEKANADGYGHRDKAMRYIDRAIDECNQAVEVLH